MLAGCASWLSRCIMSGSESRRPILPPDSRGSCSGCGRCTRSSASSASLDAFCAAAQSDVRVASVMGEGAAPSTSCHTWGGEGREECEGGWGKLGWWRCVGWVGEGARAARVQQHVWAALKAMHAGFSGWGLTVTASNDGPGGGAAPPHPQGEGEDGAPAASGGHGDGATVRLHQLLHQVEAQAGAAVPPRCAHVHLRGTAAA